MRSAALLVVSFVAGTLCVPAVGRAQGAGTQRISGKMFDVLANRAVAGIHPKGDAHLLEIAPVRDQIVNSGSYALVVESPVATPSYVNVPIEIEIGGAFVRTVFVGYRVQSFVWTAIASHDLIAGTVVEDGDVELAHVPSLGRYANSTDALIGRKLVCTVRKGQPVYIEETQTNLIVRPGASVVLIVNDGGVSVVAQAVARTGGGLGDEVNVYDPSTNKQLSGTVVGPDRVQLDILGVTQ
jgi:flagella basal body P-ring formation protein FlgA